MKFRLTAFHVAFVVSASAMLACNGSSTSDGGADTSMPADVASDLASEHGADVAVADVPPSCLAGTLCNGTCVDVMSDQQNCGSCGHACAAGLVCAAGACAASCPPSQMACGGLCTNVATDNANCGTCGNACPGGHVCRVGVCALDCGPSLAMCVPTSSDAGAVADAASTPYCADTQDDRANCGACGNSCAVGEVCIAGACTSVCGAGATSCAGSCVDVESDNANCGACGNACTADLTCVGGSCVTTCRTGWVRCAGACTNVTSDSANCGACGAACPTGETCLASTCMMLRFSGATGTTWELLTTTPSSFGDTGGFSDYTPAGQSSVYYTAGGFGFPTSTVALTSIDTGTADVTSLAGTTVPGSSTYAGTAWIGASLYYIEGTSVQTYSIATNTWSTVASGSMTVSEAQNAHDDSGHVYALTTSTEIAVFDTSTSTISYAPVTLPVGASVFEPRTAWDSLSALLFIAPSFSQPYFMSYDPASGTSATLAQIPTATSMNDIFCSDRSGHIYAVANSSGTSIYQYSVTTATWAAIPALPFDNGDNGSCTVTDSGYLYVTSGEGQLARLQLL